jgi:hypothetical protein
MVRSWSDMNQGSPAGEERSSWPPVGPEEPCPEGDRAFIVAKKRGNARGAKGGRKVEPSNINSWVTNALNVQWTQLSEGQRKVPPAGDARRLLVASETRGRRGRSLKLPCLCRLISFRANHQLESRMREIRQSGSEGGATDGRPYPYNHVCLIGPT